MTAAFRPRAFHDGGPGGRRGPGMMETFPQKAPCDGRR